MTTPRKPLVPRPEVEVFLDAVVAVAERLREAAEVGSPRPASALAPVERALHQFLGAYRTLLEFGAPLDRATHGRRWTATDPDRPEFLRYASVAIAVQQVARVTVLALADATGGSWGGHLVTGQDFAIALHEPLALDALPDGAALLLLPEQCSELLDAIATVANPIAATAMIRETRVTVALERICELVCTRPLAPRTDVPVWDETQVLRELTWTASDLTAARDDGRILFLATWDGDQVYPQFQIDGGRIHDVVEVVLGAVSARLAPWPLTLWLQYAIDQDWTTADAEQELRRIGAWLPAYAEPTPHDWTALPDADTPRNPLPTGEYFRVTHRGAEPFWFSSVASGAEAAGGRFDLTKASARGTIYLARERAGAWSETLTRIPLLALSDVLGREMWRLVPLDSVTDIAAPMQQIARQSDFANESDRAATQALAGRADAAGFHGIEFALSTTLGSAVALFGDTGATPPSTTGLGVWAMHRDPAELDEAFWTYLKTRKSLAAPTLHLRRFPTDIRVNKNLE